MAKVAWYVQGIDSADIVFAESEEDAAEKAENIDFIRDVKRKPEYDRFAESGIVPASVLVQDGWYFYCWECDRRTDDEEEEDEAGNPLPPVDIYFLGDRGVFCCKECLDSWMAENERKKGLKNSAIAEFQEQYPGATNIATFINGDGIVEISFKFPGAWYSGHWVQGKTGVTIMQSDLAAFERWRGKKAEILT